MSLPEDPSTWTLPLEQVALRRGAKWAKYDPEVLSAWVADMDFAPPAAALQAIRDLIDTGSLGYPWGSDLAFREQWSAWQRTQFGWSPDVEQTETFTTVLHGIDTALWFGTKPGDGVAVLMPVYHPFLFAIRDSGRRRVEVPLDPDGWRVTRDLLHEHIDAGTRALLLCQPHNPTGRMFDQDEVDALAEVAQERDLLVLSDEIWADLTHARVHQPLALDPRFKGRLVTLGSASKTFNLAGTRCGVAHIDHEPLQELMATMPSHLHGELNSMGVAAALACWKHGQGWLDETRAQIRSRFVQLEERLAAEAPEVNFTPPEATYLAWLDFRNTPIAEDPTRELLHRSQLALSPGTQFGTGGEGWGRVNAATSESVMDQIIDRIVASLR